MTDILTGYTFQRFIVYGLGLVIFIFLFLFMLTRKDPIEKDHLRAGDKAFREYIRQLKEGL